MNDFEESKEVSTLSRSEIIHANFFKELKKRNISNSKYAKDNNLDKSVLSKWKNMTTTMSSEQVYQAAKYFQITVNDLYYSLIEKKEIQLLAIALEYEPIKAKQTIEIKLYTQKLKHPVDVISLTIFIFSLVTLTLYFLCRMSSLWVSLIIAIPVFGFQTFKYDFSFTKTFIVDYLDDIYYKIDKSKNQYFLINIILHLFSLGFTILTFILLFNKDLLEEKNLRTVMVFFMITIAIYLLVNLYTFIAHHRKIKEEIYDNEIFPYCCFLANFYASLLPLSISVCFLYQYFNAFWYICLILLVNSILAFIEFLLISRKYSEYRIVYKEHNKEEKDLFPNC